MRIGIDIDDTITKSWEFLVPSYAKVFGVSEEKLMKSKPYYAAVRDNYTIEEYYEKVKPIYDGIVPQVPLLNGVKEIIDKLHDDGHTIIFITARNRGFTNSYQLTKDYLDSHGIYYDKLITGARNKGIICQEENVELFIDDSVRHCTEAMDVGIKTLLMENYYNKEDKELEHVGNWQDIYAYVKKKVK